MNPEPWVAVPSHARPQVCNDKTLTTLARGGVPKDRVRVFVAAAEVDEYRATLDPALYEEICPSIVGLAGQRRRIHEFHPEGDWLVQMDDDVADVRQRVDDKTHVTVEDLLALFYEGFHRAVEAGAGLWGVYPTLNPMFMKDRVSYGLKFCVGHLWGVVNSHREDLQVTIANKEDYERTLRWYHAHGTVARLDYVACKSPLYGPGGLQAADQPERRALNRREVLWLMETWPENVRISKRRSEKVGLEIRLVEAK